jgi:phage baseplate assembly protein W
MMGDISHTFGNDIDLSASADLLYVDGTTEVQQRIIRRLLTAAGDYLWHLDYGGSLGQFVGQPANQSAIENVIQGQIYQEETVAQVPLAKVRTHVANDGTVTASIVYVDAATGAVQTLSFPLGQ